MCVHARTHFCTNACMNTREYECIVDGVSDYSCPAISDHFVQ